jgi:hypothetical protein
MGSGSVSADKAKAPDVVEQLGARKDPAGPGHEMFEQAEFGRTHMDFPAGAAHAPVLPVEIEITRRKRAGDAVRPRPVHVGNQIRTY